MSPRSAITAVALVVAVAACSTAGGPAARQADQQFVAGVHGSAIDIAGYRSDGQLVKLGHAACDAFRANANMQQIASLLEGAGGRSLPPGDAGAVMSSAVNVLCPTYAGRISPVASSR